MGGGLGLRMDGSEGAGGDFRDIGLFGDYLGVINLVFCLCVIFICV